MSEEKKRGLLPGVVAIAVWMLVLCVFGLVSVTLGKLGAMYLVPCAAVAVAAVGLMARRRWGWAMTLAAVFLSGLYGMWGMVRSYQTTELVGVVLNLVFFLYLVRPEVRASLK
jgi:hypothetical protein